MNISHPNKPITETGAGRTLYNRQDYSGFWRRCVANILDGIILAMSYNAVTTILHVVASLLGTDYPGFSEWMLCAIIFWAYMIWFKGFRGSTPGYYIMGIKLISVDGGNVTIKQIVIRTMSSFLSAIPLGLGYFWIVFDTNRQAWHDKIAGTYVIKSNAIPTETIQLSRPGSSKLLVPMIVASILILFAGLIGGIMYLVLDSDAYRVSKQYIRENHMIQQEVGSTMKFGIIPSGNISTRGTSGEANLDIQVSGDKGKIVVIVELGKKDSKWQIIKAGYIDKEGNFIDITKPNLDRPVPTNGTYI